MQTVTKYGTKVLFCRFLKLSTLALVMENATGRILRSRTSIKNVSLNQEDNKLQNTSVQKKTKKALSLKKHKTVKETETPEKSPYFNQPSKVDDSDVTVTVKKSSSFAKKRQSKTMKDPAIKPEKISKIKSELETVSDIEECGWKPVNWEEMLNNILKMRKMYVAPVDSLGCEECPEEDIPPEVYRYQTLISVMLSSQTKDEVTHAAVQRLIQHGLTIDNILNTPDEKIGELIYPVGFWKTKIKYIKNTTKILKDQYNGDIPKTYNELIKLPGVGPKMAHLAMSCGWHETVGICVDTHVHRISNRLGWVPQPTKTPEQTRKALENWLPKDHWDPINVTLVGFGQTVCKPIGPSCDLCLNKNICPFAKNPSPAKQKKKVQK